MTHFSFTQPMLATILKNISGPITVGDIKDAANQFTLSNKSVLQYIRGDGWDTEVYEKLIAFFYQLIEVRNEQI